MRIDTGQQLDIVYTTENLLIVTPVGVHTSMVIGKIDDELSCLKYHNNTDGSQIGEIVGVITLSSLIMMASGYVLIVHLFFKELHTLFGWLLIFYSLGIVSASGIVIILCSMHYWIAVNSQIICHTTTVLFIITVINNHVFGTNILTHLSYIMYHCYNLKSEISKKNENFLFRCYFAYAIITVLIIVFLTIAYDLRTGNGKYTILPNGHCNFIDQYSYETLFLSDIAVSINKLVQIIMFVAYLVYFYKFKNICNVQISNIQYNQKLFKIAIAMGATIGLSYFIWMFVIFVPEYSDIVYQWYNVHPTVCNHDLIPVHKKDF